MSGFDEQRALALEQMRMDIKLKQRQSFWETPRNIAILVGAAAALAGAVGFKLGSMPQPPPAVVYLVPPPGWTLAPAPQQPAPPQPAQR